MSLWTSEQAAAATGGEAITQWSAGSVSIDSRTIEQGALFIALVGENFDGHNYVRMAFEKGASAAVVSYIPEGIDRNAPLLLVQDTEKALRDLGIYRRNESEAFIVGVTGSVGKTSTKEMLAMIFGAAGKTYATEGNLNNHLGVPLSLARMDKDNAYGIIEMGMNHAGEIDFLTRMARPDIALITTVSAVHLEFFNSVEEIAEAKAEIFSGVKENGIAVLPLDNPHYDILSAKAKAEHIANIVMFGESDKADCSLVAYKYGKVTAKLFGKEYNFTLKVKGKHQALNALAVLAVAIKAGIKAEDAITALEEYKAQAGRGQATEIQTSRGKITVIDDCYNASPASMRAAFSSMEDGGRKIAVLGDMLELGKSSSLLHAELAEDIVMEGIDAVYCAGANMKYLYDALPEAKQAGHFDKSSDIIRPLSESLQDGDVILVKGSNGMKMKPIVEALKSLEKQQAKVAG